MSLSIEFHNDLDLIERPLDSHAVTGISRVPAPLREFFLDFVKAARQEWADEVWALFDKHGEDKILTVRKWFISFTFRVKHCKPLVRLLVGDRQ